MNESAFTSVHDAGLVGSSPVSILKVAGDESESLAASLRYLYLNATLVADSRYALLSHCT